MFSRLSLGFSPTNSVFVKPTSERIDFLLVVHTALVSSLTTLRMVLYQHHWHHLGTCKNCSFSLLLGDLSKVKFTSLNLHVFPTVTGKGSADGKALGIS